MYWEKKKKKTGIINNGNLLIGTDLSLLQIVCVCVMGGWQKETSFSYYYIRLVF